MLQYFHRHYPKICNIESKLVLKIKNVLNFLKYDPKSKNL